MSIDTSPAAVEALRRTVAALEMVTDQDAIKNTTTVNAFAACVEAASIGRKVLADQDTIKSSATPEAAPVQGRVKALVWEPYPNPAFASPNVAVAKCSFSHQYQVQRDPWENAYMAMLYPTLPITSSTAWWESKGHPNLEAAKAAAQADYEARILSALEPAEAQGWHPIETAPKDGTAIVAIRNETGRDGYTFLRWQEGLGWTGYTKPTAGKPVLFDPTHWMPLPAPPVAQEGR